MYTFTLFEFLGLVTLLIGLCICCIHFISKFNEVYNDFMSMSKFVGILIGLCVNKYGVNPDSLNRDVYNAMDDKD